MIKACESTKCKKDNELLKQKEAWEDESFRLQQLH